MTVKDMISVSIVEDVKDIREGLAIIVNQAPDCFVLGTYADGETGVKGILTDTPDVILMDIQMPGISGIECVQLIKSQRPDVDVLMLTVHSDDDHVFKALQAGACGYLTKNTSPERLLEAIREVRAGGAPMSTNVARMVVGSFNSFRKPKPPLTPREREVLEQLCQGKSYKMIADALFISEDTVRHHLKNIYRKLQVNSKSEAVIKALKERLV
ncbi:response regulator transcription factor [Pontibacter sp. G13]|uniref:response regulator transcription factor n=1 Tax=Pontibacter sp. G13 TaxID=3074898 RepID=UPI00288A20A5|nr:response regulator transcription factor [Pontibacter sp. G13]WNJ20555.1 response regulator transcription factor [Pontibacter sp. G13]